MSLCNAIRFRSLCDQLSTAEKQSLLLGLVKESPDVLISSIFHGLKCHNKADSMSVYANKINDKISAIMRARDKTKQIISSKTKSISSSESLHEIPNPIINKCASYLYQDELSNLGKVCRKIYIACNTPNPLQNIELTGPQNIYPFNSELYPNAKDLHFDLSQSIIRTDEIVRNHPFLNQLDSLTLNGFNAFEPDCYYVLKENVPVCANLKKLSLKSFHPGLELTDNDLYHLLSKFPNIKYLELDSIADAQFSFIKELFPNLTGLKLYPLAPYSINDIAKYQELLYEYIDQLTELEMFRLKFDSSRSNSINCGKLRILGINDSNLYTMQCITETATNLEQITISCFDNLPNSKSVTDAARNLILRCPSLKFIRLYHFGHEAKTVKFIKGIEEGLNETKHMKRKSMKISIELERYNAPNLIPNIKSLLTELQTSKIDDYMLAWTVGDHHCDGICKSLNMNTVVIKQRCCTYSCIIIRKDGSNFSLM